MHLPKATKVTHSIASVFPFLPQVCSWPKCHSYLPKEKVNGTNGTVHCTNDKVERNAVMDVITWLQKLRRRRRRQWWRGNRMREQLQVIRTRAYDLGPFYGRVDLLSSQTFLQEEGSFLRKRTALNARVFEEINSGRYKIFPRHVSSWCFEGAFFGSRT